MDSIGSLAIENTEASQSQKTRKRGRPKLTNPNAAKLSLDRRLQLRQAQKTYRLKKEASIESYKARVADLEERLKKVAGLYSECYENAKAAYLDVTHPEVFGKIERMRENLGPKLEGPDQASPCQGLETDDQPDADAVPTHSERSGSKASTNASVFGYQAPNHSAGSNIDCVSALMLPPSQALPPECLEQPLSPSLQDTARLLGGSVPFSYSFHETTFSRRIHRYCLEHSYRLFSDDRSDPTVIYKIFRLVPCIRYKAKMLPYFERLVQGGVKDTLELPKLPFYCIGGAGSHYLHKDSEGHLAPLTNTRLPKRILGVLPASQTSGDTKSQEEYQRHLKLFGLDGEWFDCQDVEGFLKEKGVVLDQSSVFAEIQTPWPDQQISDGVDNLLDKSDMVLQDSRMFDDFGIDMNFAPPISTQTEIELSTSALNSSRLVLDVGHFLSRLLNGLVILGRAPGFRRTEVDMAFNSALRIHIASM